MHAPNLCEGMVTMPREEFEALLEEVAEKGARHALADVGLDGDDAAHDIRTLRSLLEAYNAAKRTAWHTFVKILTTGFVLALLAGAVIKLKIFGGAQ
ncbi:hypothetical protein D5085_07780 [Ectothiorhodospiraceae bacterium BW-2]|nr:hypothetical protein D5085_07780 [Ectothiorhodospiraceae bacterium BW-2]